MGMTTLAMLTELTCLFQSSLRQTSFLIALSPAIGSIPAIDNQMMHAIIVYLYNVPRLFIYFSGEENIGDANRANVSIPVIYAANITFNCTLTTPKGAFQLLIINRLFISLNCIVFFVYSYRFSGDDNIGDANRANVSIPVISAANITLTGYVFITFEIHFLFHINLISNNKVCV